MRTLAIFYAIKNNLPSILSTDVEYTIRNDNLDYSQDYGISVHIADIVPTMTRLSGDKYEGYTATIQFLVTSGTTTSSYYKAREIMQDIEDWLATLQNTKLITSNEIEVLDNGKLHWVEKPEDRQVSNADGVEITISMTKLFSSTLDLGLVAQGKTPYKRKLFSLNCAIDYFITGNNIVESPTNNDDDTNNTTNAEEPADNSEAEQPQEDNNS